MQGEFCVRRKRDRRCTDTVAPVAADNLPKDSVATTATKCRNCWLLWTRWLINSRLLEIQKVQQDKRHFDSFLAGLWVVFSGFVYALCGLSFNDGGFFLKRSDNKSAWTQGCFSVWTCHCVYICCTGYSVTLIFWCKCVDKACPKSRFYGRIPPFFFAMLLWYCHLVYRSHFGTLFVEVCQRVHWSTKLDAKAVLLWRWLFRFTFFAFSLPCLSLCHVRAGLVEYSKVVSFSNLALALFLLPTLPTDGVYWTVKYSLLCGSLFLLCWDSIC